jgi:hypothetical protein
MRRRQYTSFNASQKKLGPPFGKNTVLVDGFAQDIYYAGTDRQIMSGSLAGRPWIEVRIKMADAES